MKQYLGDGVYLEVDRGMLKLTTDSGLGPDNTIYLEPEVYVALTRFVQGRLACDISGISPKFIEQGSPRDSVDREPRD
jgi:hypothetical protein